MFILISPIPPGNGNPSDRLAQIRIRLTQAEQKVTQLEQLLTSLILGEVKLGDESSYDLDPTKPGQQVPEGLNTPQHPAGFMDVNVVRQELYRAKAYEGELRTMENFWNEVVTANKTAESKLHEQFKPA